MGELVGRYFEPDVVACVSGGPAVVPALEHRRLRKLRRLLKQHGSLWPVGHRRPCGIAAHVRAIVLPAELSVVLPPFFV